jgi:hypothetical protein
MGLRRSATSHLQLDYFTLLCLDIVIKGYAFGPFTADTIHLKICLTLQPHALPNPQLVAKPPAGARHDITRIDDSYLTRRCPFSLHLARQIQRRCLEKSLHCPTRKAITPRVRAWDQHEALRRRKSAAFARSKLGRMVGHLTEEMPLGVRSIIHWPTSWLSPRSIHALSVGSC